MVTSLIFASVISAYNIYNLISFRKTIKLLEEIDR